MTANPLITTNRQAVTRDLDSYCAWLNGFEWVRQSGEPYRIATRDKAGGGTERFLTR